MMEMQSRQGKLELAGCRRQLSLGSNFARSRKIQALKMGRCENNAQVVYGAFKRA
jgi:hypothetical protein